MPEKKANWLLRGLIILSLVVHAALLVRIADIYRSNRVTSIELTLQGVSKPTSREIPRPPRRFKAPPTRKEIERLKVTERPVPPPKPLQMESVENPVPYVPVEGIGVSDAAVAAAPSLSEWAPEGGLGDVKSTETRESYLEMVRLSIERNKKYPEMAGSSRIEGRVTVGFVITRDGAVRDVKIVKKSHSRFLDDAALQAVTGAAPFPKPPKSVFKGDVRLVITMIFELV